MLTNSEHFYFLSPMEAPCLQCKNNATCMDGIVGRQSGRIKEEATRRLKHTGKYPLKKNPSSQQPNASKTKNLLPEK